MPEINLIDFFTYFKSEVQQKEAVQLLQSAMPESLLKNTSSWVVKFREKPEAPASEVPPQCLDIIATFEGFSPTPYLCPAGVATIGYGNTFYEDGRSVTMNDGAITEPQARRMLENIVKEDFWDVLKITHPLLGSHVGQPKICPHRLWVQSGRKVFRRCRFRNHFSLSG